MEDLEVQQVVEAWRDLWLRLQAAMILQLLSGALLLLGRHQPPGLQRLLASLPSCAISSLLPLLFDAATDPAVFCAVSRAHD